MVTTKIGRISSVKRKIADSQTLEGSLAAAGYGRYPGTFIRETPFMERTGEYRTGLNPDASYIKRLERINPEAAEIEKIRVIEMRDFVLDMTGGQIDISPRSDFYRKMFDGQMGTDNRAKVASLYEGHALFNLDDPFELITFAWLRVHPNVAPSFLAYQEGRLNYEGRYNEVHSFVDDEEFESKIVYKEKVERNRALSRMGSMTPERQLKVARLLGLRVTYSSRPDVIYNELDKFINDTESRLNNIDLFNKITDLRDEDINVKYLVEEALQHSIYRVKGSRVYEGQNEVAKSKDDLIDHLLSPKHQDELLALQDKIEQYKILDLSK